MTEAIIWPRSILPLIQVDAIGYCANAGTARNVRTASRNSHLRTLVVAIGGPAHEPLGWHRPSQNYRDECQKRDHRHTKRLSTRRCQKSGGA